ncbi:hypothetical protein IF690_08755 [Pseudomonas sp. SK3(2021)]|uniref:hypothetical protein n=1 Tax=Pseudomonas sp. SK3(2021) TaxID=2841064 RepID=UPI00192B7466|nr:hypothetical protein [Pseudomonas sp. SK3(2021)]QQZ43614.1 hypothetical protein IF690_08755 [Pseudomonas sp. SK3(2021)]
MAGNLVQGFLKCKKIIELFLLNFFFCFCAEKLSRKNKKLSEQTGKKALAVNLQSPLISICSGKNTFRLVKKNLRKTRYRVMESSLVQHCKKNLPSQLQYCPPPGSKPLVPRPEGGCDAAHACVQVHNKKEAQ